MRGDFYFIPNAKYGKGYVAFVRFLAILTPPLHGGSKNFFLCKVSKNKAENDFELAQTTFQVFRVSTRERSFSNLAFFENAQNLVCKNCFLASNRAPFCFWRVFRLVVFQKKFDIGCDPLSRRNLAIFTKNVLISMDFGRLWKKFSSF